MLSEDKVEFIRNKIDQSSITIQELKDDLLDHISCFIEQKLKNGYSFEIAYQKALDVVCPNGFDEIQHETIYLLNANKIRLMKTLTYTAGLITAIATSAGFLFKILHLPGGNDLFNYGFLGFVIVFVPLFSIDRYKLSINKALSERLKLILGLSSALLAGGGVLLKMLDLSAIGNVLLVLGMLTFMVGFLPFFFFRMYRQSKSSK